MKKIILILFILIVAGLIALWVGSRSVDGAVMALNPVNQSFTVIQKKLLSGQSDASEIYVIPRTRFQGVNTMAELKEGDRVKIYVRKNRAGQLEALVVRRQQQPMVNT